MFEKIMHGIDYAVDLYRIAPFGETLFLVNAGNAAYFHDNPFTVAFSIVGSLGGIAIAAKQFRLKNRLEKIISKNGYDDRVFKRTTYAWCDRQTARVVAKRHGYLDRYNSLCKSLEK